MEGRDAVGQTEQKEWDSRYLRRLQEFCLMDDTFMSKVFEDKACAELLLQIILQKQLQVVKTVSQYSIKNLQGRSIRLDIYAVDAENKRYNIEVQREDSGANPKRARYYSSLMDANMTSPGDNYADLPESYAIFITAQDVLKGNRPLYTIDRKIAELENIPFGDDAHMIYVNGAYQDESALGQLMQDFFCRDAASIHYEALAERVGYFKKDSKGVNHMCKIMEDLYKEGQEEGIQEGKKEGCISIALNALKMSLLSHIDIAKMTGLTLDEVEDLAAQVK